MASNRNDEGMLYPSIDQLLGHINSKYTLVSVSAQRARDLEEIDGALPMIDNAKSVKAVGIALEEIQAGVLRYRQGDYEEHDYEE